MRTILVSKYQVIINVAVSCKLLMLILNKPVRSMNNYNYDDEMREEQLAREIGRKFAELGFGTVQTEEE